MCRSPICNNRRLANGGGYARNCGRALAVSATGFTLPQPVDDAGEPLDQVVAKGGEIEALQRLALAQHVGDERQPERVPTGKGQPIGMLVVGNAA